MERSLTTAPAVAFLGLPVQTDLSALDADVAILGVPRGVAYPHQTERPGSSDAPGAIRAASQRFARFIAHHDFDLGGELLAAATRVIDCGDVLSGAPDGGSRAGYAPDEGSAVTAATDAVRAILERGALPIVLGGDDSIPIPVLRAYDGRGPIVVVQVDAHLDFRDEVNGVRDGYSSGMRRASEMAWVGRIIHVGLRGVGSATTQDVADARAAGNVLITAREIRELGVETVFDALPDDAACFVTLDCDGLDPSIMPATNAPLPGGLTFDETAALLRGLARRGRVVGMDLTELVPALDVNGVSALVAVRLISNLLGALPGARS